MLSHSRLATFESLAPSSLQFPYSTTAPLCDETAKTADPCPLLPGAHHQVSHSVASTSGKIDTTITWVDEAGAEILCKLLWEHARLHHSPVPSVRAPSDMCALLSPASNLCAILPLPSLSARTTRCRRAHRREGRALKRVSSHERCPPSPPRSAIRRSTRTAHAPLHTLLPVVLVGQS